MVAYAQSQNPLTYAEALENYEAKGLAPTRGIEVVIQGENFTRQGGGKALITLNLGGTDGESVRWGETEGHWLEWEFSVPQNGLYNIALHYFPKAIEDPYLAPVYMIRSLTIDGRYPFREMEEIRLSHIWEKNIEEEETRRDLKAQDIGLELGLWAIREKPQWRLEALGDFSTSFLDPYLFHLEQGKHTLRMTSIAKPIGQQAPRSEAMDVDYILIFSPRRVPTYKEVEEQYRRNGIEETKGIIVRVEGEDLHAQGGPGEISSYISPGDPIQAGEYVNGSVPFIRSGGEPEEDFYNALGNWYQPGHWVEWKFLIPEEGLYKIVFKYFQGTIAPIPMSLRSIKIDGQCPFVEMQTYPFRYAGGRYSYSLSDSSESRMVIGERVVVKWKLQALSDPDGDPYLFYLKPGEHTLEMKPVWGPVLSGAIGNINLARLELVRLETKVSAIAARGGDPRKIDVDREIPDLKEMVGHMVERLKDVSESLTELNGGKEPPIVESIKMISEELLGLSKRPSTVFDLLSPNRTDLSNRQWSTSGYTASLARTLRGDIERLLEQQLQAALDIDYIAIASPDVDLRLPYRSPFRSLIRGWTRFVKSFSQQE
jgi:hypothetical protein